MSLFRQTGITLIEALFSDNRTVRFRVLSRDPAAVQAVGVGGPAGARGWLKLGSISGAAGTPA